MKYIFLISFFSFVTIFSQKILTETHQVYDIDIEAINAEAQKLVVTDTSYEILKQQAQKIAGMYLSCNSVKSIGIMMTRLLSSACHPVERRMYFEFLQYHDMYNHKIG